MSRYKTLKSLSSLILSYSARNGKCNFPKGSVAVFSGNTMRNIFISRALQATVPFHLTDIGEGIREVVVKEWYVKEGDRVSQFDNICEVQSDKASVTITSRYDGVIKKLYYKIDDTAFVGKPLVDIETETTDKSEESQEEKTVPDIRGSIESPISDKQGARVNVEDNQSKMVCIPSVRRLAKENNIDLSKVKATGKGGRILKEDVLNYLKGPEDSPTLTSLRQVKREESVPLRGFQAAMVKTMTKALQIPHFVYCEEISVTKLRDLMSSLKENSEKIGINITLTAFLVKAVSNALIKYPTLNSSVEENCEKLTIKHYHNIGIAMDTSQGLAVPVIKNVDTLGIKGIARELHRLMQDGKKGVFSMEDLIDGTFTVSNIGIIGGTYTSPVILSPQVAILAFGTTKVVPRFNENNDIIKEEILNISGAADHRVVDGATMARFVGILKNELENPYCLLINN